MTLERIVQDGGYKRQIALHSEERVREGDYVIIAKLQFCLKPMDHYEINYTSLELLG